MVVCTEQGWSRLARELLSSSSTLATVRQSLQPTQNLCIYSEFLSFFVLYSRLLADFLSHLGNVVISREGLAPGTQDIKETSANKQSRALNLLIIKL